MGIYLGSLIDSICKTEIKKGFRMFNSKKTNYEKNYVFFIGHCGIWCG